MDEFLCPVCGSQDTYVSRKHSCHICEDCGHRLEAEPDTPLRTIFFSYGHDANSVVVQLLREDLEKRGHEVWIDTSRIKGGDDWRRAITNGLLESSIVLGFLSEHSVRSPGVCLDELKIALTVKGNSIQTVLLESAETVMPPSTVSNIQWLDMSDWRQRYEEGGTSWEEWYRERFDDLCSAVESDGAAVFEGEITRLQKFLAPALSDTKERSLIESEYTPRPWLDEELEAWRSRSGSPRALVLFGGPGTGKSSFVAHHLHYNHRALCGVFIEWDKYSTSDTKSVIDLIAFKLAAKIPDYRGPLLHVLEDQLTPDRRAAASDADYFDLLIVSPMSQTIEGDRERLLLFIDGLDEADTSHSNALTEVLAANLSRLPRWLGVVLTSRPEQHIVHALEAQETLVVDADSRQMRDDIYTYLATALQQHLADHGRRQEILATIARNSMGSFLYATLFVDAVRDGAIDLDSPTAYPKGMDAFFRQDFRRRFPTPECFVPPRAVLEVLVAVQVIPTKLLSDALHLSIYELNEFRRDLGSLVRRTTLAASDHALEALTFAHKSIADWLADPERSGMFAVDAQRGAEVVARQCRADLCGRKLPVVRQESDAPMPEDDAALAFRQTNIGRFLARAGLWHELESFLLEDDTPLVPYWRDLTLFPEGYNTAALYDRLWSHPDRQSFFEAVQRSGERTFLDEILGRFVAAHGVSRLERWTLNLYVDIVHLGGGYEQAVALCDDYLQGIPRTKILADPELVRLATRRLHHSMFFAPVGPLIDEALELLRSPQVADFPFEYNELLFLVGGNLGVLSGDFGFAVEWIGHSLDFAVENDHDDFQARSIRKLAECFTAVGRLTDAESLLTDRVTIDSPIKTRYDLYLLGALGEVYRLGSRPDLARQCFERVRDTARVLGIPGWQAHGSLALANVFLGLGLHDDAQPYLDEALLQYRAIGQAWGQISGGIVDYQLKRARDPSDTASRELLAPLIDEADRLGYRYHHSVLTALERGNDIEFSLQFL